MQFTTQREVLEYLGKNPDDRKLIQRMRQRWELYKEDGVYILITNKQSLIDENRELKLRVQELEKSEWLNALNFEQTAEIIKLKDELNEAKIQWEYWERMYDEEVADKQNRIRKCFLWIKQKVRWADWEEFRDWVMSDEE